MKFLKRAFKRHTHNPLFKALAGLGRGLNKLYENRNHDIFSNGEVRLLKKLGTINPKIVFDVGANVGEYAGLVATNCPTAKIYSFEPVKATFDLLRQAAKDTKRIVPYNNGFFKENTTREINLYDSNAHSSLYDVFESNAQAARSETIQLIKGDDFMAEHQISKIDFLKLDVEGAEMGVLEGLEQAFQQGKIRMVQFEYGAPNIVSHHLLFDFYQFFKRHGFIVGKLYPQEVEFRDYAVKHEDFLGPNFVAIHESDHELKRLLS